MTPLDLRWPTVLASASPRRIELVRSILPEFEIDPANLDEESIAFDDPDETAEGLALAKALEVAKRHPRKLVIGGDTVVAIDNLQLAKPLSIRENVAMLLILSGKSHRVISAVALVWPGGQKVFSEVSRVTFRAFSLEEAKAYAETGEGLDKAGGYAIQGGAAGFVQELDGDLETVIGLPLERTRREIDALAEIENGRI